MVYVSFQDWFGSKFPDLSTILKFSNTVKFACHLLSQPEMMIKVICDRLAQHEHLGFENQTCDTYAHWNKSYGAHELLKEILDDVPKIADTKLELVITPENPDEERSHFVLPYIMIFRKQIINWTTYQNTYRTLSQPCSCSPT